MKNQKIETALAKHNTRHRGVSDLGSPGAPPQRGEDTYGRPGHVYITQNFTPIGATIAEF